jgi:hypothetical protein
MYVAVNFRRMRAMTDAAEGLSFDDWVDALVGLPEDLICEE